MSTLGDRGKGELVGQKKRPAVYTKGRECAAVGCTTTLSVYNSMTLCYQHERAIEAMKITRWD